MFTTLLLDADDTVFDFHQCEYNALKNTVESAGLPFSQDIFDSFDRLNAALWRRLEKGGITQPELRVQRFKELSEVCFGGFDEYRSLSVKFIDELSRQAVLLPDSLEGVRLLSEKYAVYIITNGAKAVQLGRFGISPVTQYVREIFVSEVIGVQKPQKEYFDIVLSRVEEKDTTKILVVGDSLTSDMQGGRNAGLTTCLFDPKDKVSLPHPLVDMKIHSLRELAL